METSLTDFAETKRHRPCFICAMVTPEERDEIETAWAKGIRGSVIAAWLREVKGYSNVEVPSNHAIANHFYNRHYQKRV